MKNRILIILLLTIFANKISAQIGINTTNTPPNTSAMLDISSTTKGLLIPRMTTIQKDAIPNKIEGLTVYDTDLKQFSYWTDPGSGFIWQNFGGATSGAGWQENGVHIQNTNTGNVGIGVLNPTAKLAIAGIDQNGTLAISGTDHASHFNYPISGLQNTYIRGGINGSHVLLNDSQGLGNVGIGTSTPYAKLDVVGNGQFFANPIFFNNQFSYYDGGGLSIADNTYKRVMFDGDKIQAIKPGEFVGETTNSLNINPLGGNVGIGTNFNPEYKLHLWAPGEQLLKIDGTNPLIIFNDRTSNAQYGFLRTWSSNPFNPEGLFGQELGVPPSYGADPPKHLMFSTNFATRMILKNDGEIILNGQTHKSHFYFGANMDTYIRGGKDGSNVVINNIPNGKVGIGRYPSIYNLEVNGTIKSNEVIVESGWADYVFEENYKLKSLKEVASFITKNKHLPDVPSAKEIQENGAKLSEITTKMMAKIEELTLYLIKQEAEIESLKKIIFEKIN
ncbi:MAG: hypothetical protein V4683_19740 [Bacteroidota bacterium]